MVLLVKRLEAFIKYKNMNIMQLSVLLKYNSPQKLYRLFNTTNAWPSCQIVEHLSNQFEDLNLNWLFTGTGKMLIEEEKYLDYKEKYYSCLEEKSWLATKCLEEKEKYEILLIKLNSLQG